MSSKSPWETLILFRHKWDADESGCAQDDGEEGMSQAA